MSVFLSSVLLQPPSIFEKLSCSANKSEVNGVKSLSVVVCIPEVSEQCWILPIFSFKLMDSR
jgi:hypothetical protein